MSEPGRGEQNNDSSSWPVVLPVCQALSKPRALANSQRPFGIHCFPPFTEEQFRHKEDVKSPAVTQLVCEQVVRFELRSLAPESVLFATGYAAHNRKSGPGAPGVRSAVGGLMGVRLGRSRDQALEDLPETTGQPS